MFRFSTGDDDLDETYLVKHKLRYKWLFAATDKNGSVFPLEPSTQVPRVPQYAPFPGTFAPSVLLVFGKHEEKAEGKPITIVWSRRFQAANGFSTGEIIQFSLAFAAAIITGLQTFYYKAGGFGTLPDYLALFAWGTTIDQLKNFLQKLPAAAQGVQNASTTAAATTTVAASATAQPAAPAAGNTNPPATAAPAGGAPAAAGANSQTAAGANAETAKAPDIAAPPRVTTLDLGNKG